MIFENREDVMDVVKDNGLKWYGRHVMVRPA